MATFWKELLNQYTVYFVLVCLFHTAGDVLCILPELGKDIP